MVIGRSKGQPMNGAFLASSVVSESLEMREDVIGWKVTVANNN